MGAQHRFIVVDDFCNLRALIYPKIDAIDIKSITSIYIVEVP